MTYTHPSISSTITDNSVTYLTSEGTTKLFAVLVSEKGVDNKIQLVTSASEFEFFYGEPNMKYYGQTAYNVMKWLSAGGEAYILRVLPDDAKYSNAIMNIQTKTSTKEVNISDDSDSPVYVEVPDVTIRHTVTYTSEINTSTTNIEDLELFKTHANTVDGYENHMLFAVVPKGRGEAYNDLGFRITLNSAYDSTYDFRLYNFEVQKENSAGVLETIEGPFIVSLDPDAMSLSGESMFIEYVVNKYNTYVTVIFNEDQYNKLGEIINPNVHPNKIDFLTGETRIVDNVSETYYDSTTERDEDIHFYLNHYTNGVADGTKNIIDPTDAIESSIADSDNTYRVSIYNDAVTKISDMTTALSYVKKNTFNKIADPLVAETSGDATADAASVKASGEAILADIGEKGTDSTSSTGIYAVIENPIDDLSAFRTTIDTLVDKVEDFVKLAKKLFNYLSIEGSNAENIELEAYIQSLSTYLTSIDNSKISLASQLSKVSALQLEFSSAKTDGSKSAIHSAISDVVIGITNLLVILSNSDVEEIEVASLTEISTKLNSIQTNYSEMIDKYTTAEDYAEAKENAINDCNTVLTLASVVINQIMCEIILSNVITDGPVSAIKFITNSGTTMLSNLVSGIADVKIADIKSAIDKATDDMEEVYVNTFNTQIQNYDRSVELKGGSDGSIAKGESGRDSLIDNLLIKGYTGLIDESLLDPKAYPIDVVLDANYSVSVKNAIAELATEIRGDFIAILDTNYQASAQQALDFRKNKLQVNNFRVAIFTQDFVVNDATYTGQNIQVTTPYFLASKIPYNDINYGIQWNFVGPRRGTLSGFESLSFNPNEAWKEQLYAAQVNYTEQDTTTTKLGCQLTSQSTVSALSNLNNVRTLLRIQRDVEDLMADYQFEYNDEATKTAAQQALSGYLSKWTTNRACTTISGTVYASEYDKLQKILRVKIEMVFNSIVERIAIDLIVNS